MRPFAGGEGGGGGGGGVGLSGFYRVLGFRAWVFGFLVEGRGMHVKTDVITPHEGSSRIVRAHILVFWVLGCHALSRQQKS